MTRFYPADILVTIAITVVLLAVAYVRLAKPRHDPWQPDELSYARVPVAQPAWQASESRLLGVLSARLGSPFPSPTNGKKHV